MLCVLIRIASSIYHFQPELKKKHPKLSQICSYGLFSKVLKNEFETAVVNEPSVFEPLQFYCIIITVIDKNSPIKTISNTTIYYVQVPKCHFDI